MEIIAVMKEVPPGDAPTGRKTPWIPLLLLTSLVILAWCVGMNRFSADNWNTPTQYLDGYFGDVVGTLAGFKATAEGDLLPFTWKTVRRLGAPYEGDWNDWPSIEEIPMFFWGMLARFCGLFAGLNLSLLLGHVLAAVTFFFVARALDCLTPWAFVGGLAFGLAPYIFAQSPHHITVAYAWHVPLFLLVWKWVATDPGLIWGSRRFQQAIGIAIVAGLQNVYYTNIFCQLTLLGAATLVWRTGSKPPLRSAVAVIGAAAVVFALMNIDTWTYRSANGANAAAFSREYKWLEIYGLKLVDLLVPPSTHHATTFAQFGNRHRAAAVLQDEGSYLGLVGLAALTLLVSTAVADVVKRRSSSVPLAAWQILWIVLCFSTGGLNTIVGAFGFTLFRTGSRASIVILAIALLYAAERLTRWQRQGEKKLPPESLRISVVTVAAGLCAVILWDQVPRTTDPAQIATIARHVAADREFTAAMEAALPTGAMVFQLPVMNFPESPAAGVPAYDHFRPYLYSSHLRFSFGSIKGREREAWQSDVQRQLLRGAQVNQQSGTLTLVADSVQQAVTRLLEKGFLALYINRNGFPDRGQNLVKTLAELGFTNVIESTANDLVCVVLQKGG